VPRALATITADTDLRHRRLGHPGPASLQRLASSSLLPLNKVSPTPSLCHVCQLGRHVRLPFATSTTSTKRPFELIHCDMWALPVESVSGFKYFLVLLDDFTHFLWIFLLR
jgi:histone deacetylase 1/2